jgi:hypothetical protein
MRWSSPFRGRASSEPHSSLRRRPPTVQDGREVERRRPPLFPTPRAKRRRESTVGCAEGGRGNGLVASVGRADRSEGPPPPSGPKPMREDREVPSSDAVRAPLVIGAACGSEGWSAFRTTSDRDPRFGVPREGERRRGNPDAFHLREPGARTALSRVSRVSPAVGPSLRGPSFFGRWRCNRGARASFAASYCRARP